MKPAVVRLVIAAVLFVGWIGYLAYLWQATLFFRPSGEPLVLSRPQIEVAEVIVIARVSSARAPVKIEEVLFPEKDSPVKAGETLVVANLADCHPPARFPLRKDDEAKPDLTGPGSYLLPLHKKPKTDGYEVVPIPPSPSYSREEGPPRIYPVDDPRLRGQTLAQLHAILPTK
jgi:hypothetical protein